MNGTPFALWMSMEPILLLAGRFLCPQPEPFMPLSSFRRADRFPRARILSLAALASPALLASTPAAAVDLDAGDYDPAKPGTTLALVYLQHAERDEWRIDDEKLPGDNRLNSDVTIVRVVHYVDIGGVTVAPQVLVPVAGLRGRGDRATLGKASGLGDIILAAPIWLVNKPESNTYFGITPYLYLPTGDYKNSRTLNVGEDRWKLNLQAAGSVRIAPRVALDAGADITVYGKTGNDYAGGQMSQKVGYQVQSSLRYFLSSAVDLRAGISHADFGKCTQASIVNAATTQTKFWVGSAIKPFGPTQLILTYGRDLDVNNGFKEANRINVRLLYAF
jgi:hypothetical protein